MSLHHGDIDKIHHRGALEDLGHAAAADEIGRDDARGPRPFEFVLVAMVRRPRENEDLRPQALGRECDEDVVGIGRQRGHQPLGAFDAGGQERLLGGGIHLKPQIPLLLQVFDGLVVLFDDHEGNLVLGQLGGDDPADSTEAADDEVIGQRRNPFFQLSSPEKYPQLPFDEAAGNHPDRVAAHADPHHDHHHGDGPADGGQGLDLRKPHRADGDDGHVEGVEERHPFKIVVAQRSEGDGAEEKEDGRPKFFGVHIGWSASG